MHCSAISNFELDTKDDHAATVGPHVRLISFTIVFVLIGRNAAVPPGGGGRACFSDYTHAQSLEYAAGCCAYCSHINAAAITATITTTTTTAAAAAAAASVALYRLLLLQPKHKHGLLSR